MTKSLHPQISVIIPTKDRVDYIAEAIESVLKQTFQDFEILIIDGSSTDATKNILRNFTDTRILYFPQNGKKSLAGARNIGIKQSHGKFIAFLDDDDLWMPRKLEKQVAVLRQNQSYGLVYTSHSFVMQSDGKVIGLYNRPTVDGFIYPRILEINLVGNCNGVLARKKCFETELFDENLLALEDWDMWIRLGKKFPFKHIDEPLEAYRLHLKRMTRGYFQVLRASKIIFNKLSEDIHSSANRCEASRCWHLLLGLAYLQSGYEANAREEYAIAIRMSPRSVGGYIRFLSSFIGPQLYNSIQIFLELKAIGRTRKKL
jgi:glycosyltransferase involved in cell wall biosynthesis